MTVKPILGILACSLLAGCAAPMTRLTLHSVPEGATIMQNGAPIGTAPVALTYNTRAAFRAGQCFTVAPITARWISGANRTWAGQLCPATGPNQAYTFERPIGAPNETADNAFGAQLRLVRAQQAVVQAQVDAQIEAQNQAALMNAAGTLGNTLGCAAADGCVPPPPVANYLPSPPITYQSTVQPFSDPPVTCHLDPTGTTATCH